MIEIKGLSKRFGKLQVLKSLDLNIEAGKISAILGPNGSGKTTLIKTILGMVVPDAGTIAIDGQEILHKWEYREHIGYLPQIARFPENLKVKELIGMVSNIRKMEGDSTSLINLFKLEPYLNKVLGNLSGGTRQKVNIVLTMMFDSPLLVLDEPTAGLDPVALIKLKELIQEEKRRGKTILFTTHIISLVEELSDEIIFLLEGKTFFQGGLDVIKKTRNNDNLEKVIADILEEQHQDD